jgi:hypothetical protein
MKHLLALLLAALLVFAAVGPSPVSAAPPDSVIPTISIVSVATDTSVTIRTHNFPAQDSFDVLMGKMGTRGVNGIKVTTISSGAGGSFTLTFNIPDALKGLRQIAIRLQSSTGSGYFAYNWFYNNTAGSGTGTGAPGTTSIPTFSIVGVVADANVTIQTNNFPANDSFDVLMGRIGTRGVNGIKVAAISSGAGGSFKATFNIPDALKGRNRIAIRLQSSTGSGYFAFNWFFNNTTGSGTGTGAPGSGYSGIPTFFIASVVRNKTVTVTTNNLPPNDKFDVLMGPMGTRGVNGYYVTTIDSATGGAVSLTFDIPTQLKGSHRIAIRLQSKQSGYFAFNWFYNNTAN